MKFEEYRKHDATSLAALIANREVSGEEVLEAAIARAERIRRDSGVHGPQCYHVQFGIRLLNDVAETGAQFGCALNSFQTFGMQFGPAVILEHQCDPQSA